MTPAPSEQLQTGIKEAQQLRQQLHRFPELSGKETATHQRILDYFQPYTPDAIYPELGASQTGLVVAYHGQEEGPTLMLRADIDGLPIQEAAEDGCVSEHAGCMHACGHDGHTAMLAGLAGWLSQKPLKRGRLLLLFQPAEETGEGAAGLLADPRFRALAPDYIFGLHNIPGAEAGKIYCKPDAFCFASTGLKASFQGQSSHAAEPEKAHSPAFALSKGMQEFQLFPNSAEAKLTLTHARLGEPTFGITPGEAIIFLTLRAITNQQLKELNTEAMKRMQTLAQDAGLKLQCEEVAPFPATRNDAALHAYFLQAFSGSQFSITRLENPYYWSEDFGHYQQLAPSYFFGLGAGTSCLPLHHPSYAFPDSLLAHGTRIWQQLIAYFLIDKTP